MPLLKFRCKACGAVFDSLVAHGKMDEVQCEACGGSVERAYEGACLFGATAASASRSPSCPGSCEGHSHGCGHSGGCSCGAHH